MSSQVNDVISTEKVDILIVCCDIGGAKAIYPVFKLLKKKFNIKIICTVYSKEVFRGFSNKIILELDHSTDYLSRILYNINPKLLFTGTSEFSNLERLSWKVSREMGIVSVAIIDSWTNPKDRFKYYYSESNSNTELSQPDVVSVPDQMLKSKIFKGGWCTSDLKVCGQPHLEQNLRKLLRSRNASNILKGATLFISEPVSEKCHTLGEDIGYSQFSVATKIVNEVLSDISILEIKPHPKENIDNWIKWKKLFSEEEQLKIKISKSKLENLITKSEVVVGMASMGLIEAAYSGAKVMALQPNRKFIPNIFIDECEYISLIINNDRMDNIFQLLRGNKNHSINIKNLPFYKSIERTSNLILKYL